jgi:DNA repair protein RecN (Recombination protein N)
MLLELAVRDLGVIDELSLVLGPGMTALTGETGAGKTLVVTAIELLVGGRSDPSVVRAGAAEAVVEGRFVLDGDEHVVRRVIPVDGRSRAYLDGRLATAAALAEFGARVVDLHGQHSHQSLLRTAAQRDALDRSAGIDLTPLREARAEVAVLEAELATLGGDERELARQLDLLRYQVRELTDAEPKAGEDVELEALASLLTGAEAHRGAGEAALAALTDEDGAAEKVGAARAAIAGRDPFAAIEVRIRALEAEVDDVARDVRAIVEQIVDDPERLSGVRERLTLLGDLRRKYGDTIDEVLAYAAEASERLDDLEHRGERAAALAMALDEASSVVSRAEAEVGAARRRAAPALGEAATAHLRELALPDGVIEPEVGSVDPGDDVTFLFSANRGEPPAPLKKVASGGELARVMLALRLVLTSGPETLVFDEVDAGIGGAAAVAVGKALVALGSDHQVLVVTHLPQVAAFADAQVAVTKESTGDRVTTRIRALDPDERVAEVARMLSGSPESMKASEHAIELLAEAATQRDR